MFYSNQTVFKNKKYYVPEFISKVRENGGHTFWILNKVYNEIYEINTIQITDFDMEIRLINSLLDEEEIRLRFVIHMRDKILEFLEEVPGTIYENKLECFRSLYKNLNEKVLVARSKKYKKELEEKISYVENLFPQLII